MARIRLYRLEIESHGMSHSLPEKGTLKQVQEENVFSCISSIRPLPQPSLQEG